MILCLDYGERYIGMAAAHLPDIPPHRLGTIDQKAQSALGQIQEIVAREGVQKILVGVPLNLDGNPTQQTHRTLTFIATLRTAVDVAVAEVDETLTSAEAGRWLRHEGGKKEDEHAEAARLMLADYLAQLGRDRHSS